MTAIRRRLLVLTAALAAAAAPALADEVAMAPLVQAFQTYCVATSASADTALAAARRDGFADAPADVQARFRTAVAPDATVLVRQRGREVFFIMLAHGRVNADVATDICSVGADPVPTADQAVAAITAWVGHAPSHTDPGQDVIFAYVEDANGQRTELTSMPTQDMRAAILQGRSRIVTVDTRDGANAGGLMFTIPHPDQH